MDFLPAGPTADNHFLVFERDGSRHRILSSTLPMEQLARVVSLEGEPLPPAFPEFRWFPHWWDTFHRRFQQRQLMANLSALGLSSLQQAITSFRPPSRTTASSSRSAKQPQGHQEATFRVPLDLLESLRTASKRLVPLSSRSLRRLKEDELVKAKAADLLALKRTVGLSFDALAKLLGVGREAVRRFFLSPERPLAEDPEPATTLPPPDLFADLNDRFLRFFRSERLRLRTLDQLKAGFERANPYVPRVSRSHFFRRFIQGNGIRRKKCKAVYPQYHPERRAVCRVLFQARIFPLLHSGQTVYFFDESAFEIDSSKLYAFGFRGEDVPVPMFSTPVLVHLMLIVTQDRLVAAHLSTCGSDGQRILDFLRCFLYHRRLTEGANLQSSIIVLDNNGKYRIPAMKRLAKTGQANLMFTVPRSPFTNFIEQLFGRLKKLFRAHPDHPYE